MTILQERPTVETSAGTPSAPVPATATDSWFNTGDHKRLGVMFIQQGMRTLQYEAIQLVQSNVTTMEEVVKHVLVNEGLE